MPLGTTTEMDRQIVTCVCGRNGKLNVWRDGTKIVRHVDRVVESKPEMYDFCLNGVNSLPAIFFKPKDKDQPKLKSATKVQKPWKRSLRRSNSEKTRLQVLYSQ